MFAYCDFKRAVKIAVSQYFGPYVNFIDRKRRCNDTVLQ